MDWVQRNRSAATYEWYRYRLQDFVDKHPQLTIEAVRPHHVEKWAGLPHLAQTSRRNLMRAVKRSLKWAVAQGYIESSPIAHMEVPGGEAREVYVTPEEFDKLLDYIVDPAFADLLIVIYECGFRPQRILRLEARHVDLAKSRCVFSPSEAKVKSMPRVVYFSERATAIIKRWMQQSPNGPLFRNKNGRQWTKDAIGCALDRLQVRMGKAIYAITLPGIAGKKPNAEAQLPQSAEVDLAYDLTGVEADWRPASVDVGWHGWIPHLDLDAARRFTMASADHDALWRQLESGGTLTLRAQPHLRQMLRPDVQPGSQIDFEYPPEVTTVVLESNCPMEVSVEGAAVTVTKQDSRWLAEFSRPSSNEGGTHQLEVRLRHEPETSPPTLNVSYRTNEDASLRALPPRRVYMPWANLTAAPHVAASNEDVPELKGGNWLRGREIFFGEKAMCSKCHLLRGEGSKIGPDLSNLPQRDYASVLRDITKPSDVINPDYVAHVIVTNDGQILTGAIRSAGEELIIGQQDGKETRIRREDVDSLEPSSLSIMPEHIPEALGPESLRDLMTFLLIEPPHMPNYGPLPPPPPRSMEEVQAILAGAPAQTSNRPIHVVLVAGRKDHGLGEHDYPAWQKAWQKLLAMAKDTRVTTADGWPSGDDLESADVLVFYQQGTWTPERARDIDRFLARGGGLVYIHFAVDGGQDAAGFAERIGLAWQGGRAKFRHGPLDVAFSSATSHPIARNFDRVHFYDESYWNLTGDSKRIHLLGTGIEDGTTQPLFWTATSGKGRAFVSIPGHFAWTFDDPLFRTLLLRGIAWSAGEPVDRFNELVTPGARIRMSSTIAR